MTMHWATVVYVAYDPEDVKPGWIAFVLVVALAVATYLLWRSMNKQLRNIKVPTAAELEDDGSGPHDEPADPPTGERPSSEPGEDPRPTA
ncbi:MAG: hypothetical protein H0U36_11340 [Nocardioidaceae bacterium]|nr:hypothetical protein [Nocardioidaceae bacterium]